MKENRNFASHKKPQFTFKLLILCYHSLHVIGLLIASPQKSYLLKVQQPLSVETSRVQSTLKYVRLFQVLSEFQ